jgi:hypothetical protein
MILNRASRFSTILLLMCLIVLPQSYFTIKAVALGLFLMIHLTLLATKAESTVSGRDFLFYALLCTVAIIWSIVGVARGASTEAILANLKLYFGWSCAYFVILTLMRNARRMDVLHGSFVASVFAIAALNLFALADAITNAGLVSEAAREELGLQVELYDGYVRFGANNIASLFFLVGYLIAFKCFNGGRRDRAGTLALFVGLTVVVLSGRRALWLAICMVPAITFGVSAAAKILGRMTHAGKRLMITYALGIVAAAGVYVMASSISGLEFFEYLQAAFSEEDERSIQSVYLIESFKQHPLLGSGYGGFAGYTRNAQSPWLYELTYYQILFNLGLVGAAALLAGLAYFLHLALNTVRRAGANLPVSAGILVGFLTILIGSYSNPYMQFFDSMVFIMLFVSLSGASGPVLYLRRGVGTTAAVSP